jgi:twitching motility protein PilT
VLQTGQKFGMQTLDMGLMDLVNRGVVSREEAQSKSSNPSLFAGPVSGASLASARG